MYEILVATTVATTVIMLPLRHLPLNRIQLEQQYKETIDKLPPLDVMRLLDVIEQDHDCNTWHLSYGVGGQIDRIRRARLLRRLVQLKWLEDRVPKQQANLVWMKLLEQEAFTAASLFFWAVPFIRNKAARRSIQAYCFIASRTSTICVTNGSPECLLKLDELL
jgi:hypothetical protein